jgi:hypothetical protein
MATIYPPGGVLRPAPRAEPPVNRAKSIPVEFSSGAVRSEDEFNCAREDFLARKVWDSVADCMVAVGVLSSFRLLNPLPERMSDQFSYGRKHLPIFRNPYSIASKRILCLPMSFYPLPGKITTPILPRDSQRLSHTFTDFFRGHGFQHG